MWFHEFTKKISSNSQKSKDSWKVFLSHSIWRFFTNIKILILPIFDIVRTTPCRDIALQKVNTASQINDALTFETAQQHIIISSKNHVEQFCILYYRLSFPGCCWMSSKRYFLANSINPFMGRLGLSQSFSFLILAGDGGGGDPFMTVSRPTVEVGTGAWWPKMKAEPAWWIARGEVRSSLTVENSKRLKRSQRSGVRIASGWLGGRQVSPVVSSWHLMP